MGYFSEVPLYSLSSKERGLGGEVLKNVCTYTIPTKFWGNYKKYKKSLQNF
jgi:hypothetical protein